MPGRNTELIRQWTLLREISSCRRTIPELAAALGVSTRTVRRDLRALETAGFPLEEDEVEGRKLWRVPKRAMAGLERSGLTLAELASLYLSRALLECFAETTVLADLQGALDKVEAALPRSMRTFLDRLPKAVSAKSAQAKRHERNMHVITLRLLEAIMGDAIVTMQYNSNHSRRLKEYVVHPYRLVHAQGGLYLVAFVPEYREIRTFAVERIRTARADTGTFKPVAELGSDPFADSMGVYRGGPTCKVHLRFSAAIADRVKERIWHTSQQFRDRADGSTVMTLEVTDDYALRSWILGFGSGVRVLAPAALVEWAVTELETTREQYGAGRWAARPDPTVQPALPFSFLRLAAS